MQKHCAQKKIFFKLFFSKSGEHEEFSEKHEKLILWLTVYDSDLTKLEIQSFVGFLEEA